MIKKGREGNNVNGQTSNRILGGTTIEGEVHSDGDFRVDGTIKGTINITGKLVIGEKGVVEGEVTCGSANVSGKFDGTLKVEDLLSLEPSAFVKGDILTGKLSIVPGAEFSGSCSMGAVVRQMQENNEEEKAPAQKRSAKQSEQAS